MLTIKTLHEICAECGGDFTEITQSQNDAIHETALSLTEVAQIHLNGAFIEILEFEHEGEADSFTVYVAHHESAIFEAAQVGSQFVATFKMCNRTDAIACAENIMRMCIARY
jgi:hypothetical protein